MTSINIGTELKQATQRQSIKQKDVAREIYRAANTVSEYYNGTPTPLDAAQDMAATINDSDLSQQLAHIVFGTIPTMESNVYEENALALEILQDREAAERKQRKQAALIALTKQDESLNDNDLQALNVYLNEYLDEILIEIKLVSTIAAKTGMSLMDGIKQRHMYWIQNNFLRK